MRQPVAGNYLIFTSPVRWRRSPDSTPGPHRAERIHAAGLGLGPISSGSLRLGSVPFARVLDRLRPPGPSAGDAPGM